MKAILPDGWIELDSCKEYHGQDGQMLYRTPCGHWLLFTDNGYQWISQDDAHQWLVVNGHYPQELQLTAL